MHTSSAKSEDGAKLAVIDVLRLALPGWAATHSVSPVQHKVMRALMGCRTAALGGHLHKCADCGHEHPVYNACRNQGPGSEGEA